MFLIAHSNFHLLFTCTLLALHPTLKTSVLSSSQPSIEPGECWAFRGDKGYVTVRLSTSVIPESFTIQHATNAPDYPLSAPAKMRVLAFADERSETGVEVARFELDPSAGDTQNFPAKVSRRHRLLL